MPLSKRLKNIQPSYIREILQLANHPDIISLAGGLPATKCLPVSLLADVVSDLANDAGLFQYTNSAGYEPLIVDFSSRYKVPDSHAVLITTGSQQGIDLCVRAFIDPGDKVVVEQPCYLGALQALSVAGANIVPVQQMSDGPNMVQLEMVFAAGGVKFFYAVPDFHNPSGCCWSLTKRKQVAELCLRYQVVLVEDAPYRELRFSGDSLPMVTEYCRDLAISLHSFSKIIAPGLRVAAMVVPKRWQVEVIKLKQVADLHTSVPMQWLALKLLNHEDYTAHLALTVAEYHRRYNALAAELVQQLGEYATYDEVVGGMFVWLNLPGYDTSLLAQAALSHRVAVVPGVSFFVGGKTVEQNCRLRLNFTNAEPFELRKGVERLHRALLSFS